MSGGKGGAPNEDPLHVWLFGAIFIGLIMAAFSYWFGDKAAIMNRAIRTAELKMLSMIVPYPAIPAVQSDPAMPGSLVVTGIKMDRSRSWESWIAPLAENGVSQFDGLPTFPVDSLRWRNKLDASGTPYPNGKLYRQHVDGVLKIYSASVAYYLKWPFALLVFALGLVVMFKGPQSSHRNVYDLDHFIAAQARAWPYISPFIHYNPGEDNARAPGSPVPGKLPLFAEALNPAEFVVFNRIAMTENGLDTDKAKAAFSQQLGARWKGVSALPDYARALFAAFALKGAQKRDECDTLLGLIALSWSKTRGLKLTPAARKMMNSVLRDAKLMKPAEAVAARHAWVNTAMLATLKWARDNGGVLAPAQFVWLRAVDRGLWYPMNNLMRRSFHPEAAGAMAHFIAEEKAGRGLLSPKVEAAIMALDEYFVRNPLRMRRRVEGDGQSRGRGGGKGLKVGADKPTPPTIAMPKGRM